VVQSSEEAQSVKNVLVTVIHSRIVSLAGQVAQNSASQSVTEQLTAQIWLTDIATFDEMNAVWDAWLSPDNPPGACVEARLAQLQFPVEIMGTAAVA
jgi:enamine deaminase RidA (YjgF/YER057c/UK114 family)